MKGPINLFDFLKLSLSSPLEIHQGRKMTKNIFFALFIALVIISLIPPLFTLVPEYQQFRSDVSEVEGQLPDFAIEDDQIKTDQEDYIHFTDTISLYFDPDNQMTEDETIDRNVELNFSPINIALSQDQMTLYVYGSGQSISYANLPDFNQDQFSFLLNSMTQINLPVILLAFFVLFGVGAIILIYQYILVALTNYFISIFYLQGLGFKAVFKISLLAIALPTLALSIASVVGLQTSLSGPLFTIFSILIFFLSIRRLKKAKKAN